MRAPNVFTISPALPFIDTFVAALLKGEIVADVGRETDPFALADTTIFVPTRRSARALADTLLARSRRASVMLPRILPLGALESTETELFFREPDPSLGLFPLPRAASSIWRRLRLAVLIQSWASAIDRAIRSIDSNGHKVLDPKESFRVASSPVDAFALAGDLAALIDEMAIEDVAWKALDDLRMSGFDDYWRITTTFLTIAFEQWPKTLAEADLVDPATRQIALVEAQVRALADGLTEGPVIAIGSTGTNKATGRLLAAIASAPNGAVVLPGLDLDLDEVAWALVSGAVGDGQEPSFGHPQAAMARLLPRLGIARASVKPIGAPDAAAAIRARFVAEALRPADTTDRWRAYRRAVPQRDLRRALENVSLIDAADEREEALCLAIAMREVIETPGRTAALVTPDRELARRVRGELLRWNIEVHDTGGEPLASRPLGVLARLVAAAACTLGAREIAALLMHPLASFGRDRHDVMRLARQLDIGVLRVVSLGDKSSDVIFTEARAGAKDRHAHPAARAISATDWMAMASLWNDLIEALGPLRALQDTHGIGQWIAAHRACIADIAENVDGDEADLLAGLFDDLGDSADARLRLSAEAYDALFGRLATEATLRTTETPHPRLQIYGLLEARLMKADVMLLGGLDEGVWPPQATTDPFLNRPMRAELGLLPPERRIGQTAHDFEQAMGHQTIVLSHARKRGGSPCVPSRFLLRLDALGGDAWKGVRGRGAHYLWLASVLDRPDKAPVAIGRPRPAPPIDLRPTHLSVTEVETLRRDPYAIYAAKILRLVPLPKIGATFEPSEFGSLMHEVLNHFVVGDLEPTIQGRQAQLIGLAEKAFQTALQDPLFRAFRWPVVRKALDVFLVFDAKQREGIKDIQSEIGGRLEIALADTSPFILTARADRIDFHRDGSATLIDYKTGQPPGKKEVLVGFAPQLTLEAAMLRAGGFGTPHEGTMAATYLKLGGKDGGFARDLTFDNESFEDVVDRHFAGFKKLISSFRSCDTAYPSRPFPKYARKYGDYDHLARVREWSLTADDEAA